MKMKTQDPKVLKWGILVLVLLWLIGFGYIKFQSASATDGNSTTATIERQIAPPPPTPEPVEYGTFMVRTDRMTECEIGPGEGMDVSPVRVLEYDWYVNGILAKHVSIRDTNYPKIPTHETRRIGYRLSPNQGVDEITFAYVRYITPTPPSDWYARALRSSGAR